jgi:hypothetical protein
MTYQVLTVSPFSIPRSPEPILEIPNKKNNVHKDSKNKDEIKAGRYLKLKNPRQLLAGDLYNVNSGCTYSFVSDPGLP